MREFFLSTFFFQTTQVSIARLHALICQVHHKRHVHPFTQKKAAPTLMFFLLCNDNILARPLPQILRVSQMPKEKLWITLLTTLVLLLQTSKCQVLLVPWEGDFGAALGDFRGVFRAAPRVEFVPNIRQLG